MRGSNAIYIVNKTGFVPVFHGGTNLADSAPIAQPPSYPVGIYYSAGTLDINGVPLPKNGQGYFYDGTGKFYALNYPSGGGFLVTWGYSVPLSQALIVPIYTPPPPPQPLKFSTKGFGIGKQRKKTESTNESTQNTDFAFRLQTVPITVSAPSNFFTGKVRTKNQGNPFAFSVFG